MNRADEKKAFEAMLAEISDSDEEEFAQHNQVKPANQNMYRAESKTNHEVQNLSNMIKADMPSRGGGRNGYKMSKEEQEIENFGATTQQSAAEAQAEQMNITKRWLVRPCSRGDRSTMKCYVERERNNFGLQTVYRCYLEGSEGQPGRFMMSAKKKAAKQTSYYLISLDMDPQDDRGSETVLGKIRGNSVGSRYIITDHGIAPEKTAAPSMFRKEFCVVGFEFDSGGPSRIDAWIPMVSPSGVPSVWQPDGDSSSMEAKIDEKNLDRITYLHNKQPKWDEAHGGHVLNFQGRVTESSVKNFQLCSPDADDAEEVLLQFGRVGKHKFNMDLKFPLSPLQAFGICIACMDGKIADRKGYEYLKKLTGGKEGATEEAPGKQGSSSVPPPASNNGNTASSNNSNNSTSVQQIDGNMKGSSSISGMLRETMPSGQYLRDKLYRSFK